MAAKVTATLVINIIMLMSCSPVTEEAQELCLQMTLDSIASASIDSAYKVVQAECAEKNRVRLPVLVDSILKADSLR